MSDGYLTTRKIRERYSISAMTLWRWEHDPAIHFPTPLRVNRRKLYCANAIEAWERARAAGSPGGAEYLPAAAINPVKSA